MKCESSSSIARNARTRIQGDWWSGCWQAILSTCIDDLSLHFLFTVEQINAAFALFANLDLVAHFPARWEVAGQTFVADDVFFLRQGEVIVKRIAIEDGTRPSQYAIRPCLCALIDSMFAVTYSSAATETVVTRRSVAIAIEISFMTLG